MMHNHLEIVTAEYKMQSIVENISFQVSKEPSASGHFLVWVDIDDCVVTPNLSICLSPDNRTRGEREPLFQRLAADMKDVVAIYGKAPICFASSEPNTACFAALFYAGLCGVKLAPLWPRFVETTEIFEDISGKKTAVPKYHITNASFRLILARFK